MDALFSSNEKSFNGLFSSVYGHQNKLGALNVWWDKVSLVGKINSLNVPQSLLGNMLETKAEFADLQEVLIENLLNEQLHQYYRNNLRVAQSVVEIPNRNLFERTADVGFLATDAEVIALLEDSSPDEHSCEAMQQRLLEYAAKYSVYDEIMLFDVSGELRVRMTDDEQNGIRVDPIIKQVLAGNQEYWEICRHSELLPKKQQSSLFLAAIKSPQSNQTVGVLCLSFKLEGEMAALFDDLNDNSKRIYALLGAKGDVIASNDAKVLAAGERLSLHQEHQVVTVNNQNYLATVVGTTGYQGYLGLGWRGCVLLPLTRIGTPSCESNCGSDLLSKWKGFSQVLNDIQHRAKIVTEDLDLVVLNGRIAAARSDADEFIPILEEIRNIGRQMQETFSRSVSELMTTALSTRFSVLSFQASQAIDIMDRNLYERANDCRWWALTSIFIEYLKNPEDQQLVAQISDVLAYINSLYTVYTGLYLYDRAGQIIAVSTAEFQSWVGTKVHDDTNWQGVLKQSSSQQYCVSAFAPSEYYQSRPTYIYNAAVRHHSSVVGGIGIVFDSEPQFKEMLDDVIGDANSTRYGLFVDRKGHIISATDGSPWQVGQMLNLPADIRSAACGTQGAGIYPLGESDYVLGYAVSKGYREYKTTDGYQNDVIAIIYEANEPIKTPS